MADGAARLTEEEGGSCRRVELAVQGRKGRTAQVAAPLFFLRRRPLVRRPGVGGVVDDPSRIRCNS